MKVKTYDIINAGPRNRFMASGRIVSNSSRGAQLQNLLRMLLLKKAAKMIAAIRDVTAGIPHNVISDLYGPAIVVAGELLRPTLIASPGTHMARGDSSQIEARVLPWLAGAEWKLDKFRAYDAKTGPDLYIVAATGIYRAAEGEITADDPRRQIGKVCIAEGQLVDTPRGLVPIEKVRPDDLVWDGEEWVTHDGVVYQGVRDCVAYDGLIATPDHRVFVENAAGAVEIRFAAARGLRLRRAGMGREDRRAGAGGERHDHPGSAARPEEGSRDRRMGEVSIMRRSPALASLAPHSERQEFGLPAVRKPASGAALAHETTDVGEVSLREPQGSPVSRLRRSGNPISISDGFGRWPVDFRESPAVPVEGRVGQDRQQWALRTRESEMGIPVGASQESAPVQDTRTAELAEPVFTDHDGEVAPRWTFRGRDHGYGGTGRGGAPEELAWHSGPLRVYDILNAGPRRRFTVAGRLVHNCELALGFEGGARALQSMAKAYRMKIPVWTPPKKSELPAGTAQWEIEPTEGTDEWIKRMWRAANPEIASRDRDRPGFWRRINQAAIDCMRSAPGPWFPVGDRGLAFVRNSEVLCMRLPSGRMLWYWSPRLVRTWTPWGTQQDAVVYRSEDSVTHQWREFQAYGGLWTENCLAGDTEVLTDRGWIPLRGVRSDDLVWDGVEWVGHRGLLSQGEQDVIDFAGVRVTPDHKILTADGWRAAMDVEPAEAWRAFSESHRLPTEYVDRGRISGDRERQGDMVVPLRLRADETRQFEVVRDERHEMLRVSDLVVEGGQRIEGEHDARDVEASGLCGVGVDVGAMRQPEASRVPQLRGAWGYCLPGMAGLLHFLGLDGANLRTGALDRTDRQRLGLPAGQLPLGDSHGAEQEQASERAGEFALGSYHGRRGGGPSRAEPHDVVLQDCPRVAGRAPVRSAGREPVFDLLNAGPRHRFTVRGTDGRPFIVSNCVQATARDLMAYWLRQMRAEGLRPVLSVHDEGVTEADTRRWPMPDQAVATIEQIMRSVPTWAAGLPVNSEASAGPRYVK